MSYFRQAMLATLVSLGFASPLTAQTAIAPSHTMNDSWGVLRGTSDDQASASPVFHESLDPNDAVAADAQQTSAGQAGAQSILPNAQGQGRMQRTQSEPGVLDDINTGTPSSMANVRQGAVEAGVRRAVETDPFAAQGFRLGTWNGNMSFEQVVGFSSNLERSSTGSSGAYSQADAVLSLQSDWARHQANIAASASYRRSFEDSDTAVPSANITGGLRLDLSDQATLTVTTGYNYSTEAVTSTTIGADVSERPGVHGLNGSVELANSSQRLSFLLRGQIASSVYEDGKLTTGAALSQDDRNNVLYQGSVRIGYETSPAVMPFVEASYGQRVFEHEVDRNGQRRDSVIYAAKVGAQINLSEKATGEVSLGYQSEQFEDSGIEDLAGFTIDANLNWSPWRETQVALSAATSFNGSTLVGQNGTIVHALGASIERSVNDRLTLDMRIGADITQASDGEIDTVLLSTGAGANYAINKNLAVTGDVTFEHQITDNAAQEYSAATVQAGVRWQK